MSYSKFNYCPFCGSHIPDHHMVKYCPFCGGNLLLSDDKKSPTSQCDNHIPILDHVLVDNVVTEYDEHTEIYFDQYNKSNSGKIKKTEYYSIILKDAPNKQNLVRKLEKVLLRGYFAIRLAVDNMPSLIIYKAKGDDITYLNEVFIEEQASTSMIAGDFDHNPVIEELFKISNKLSPQVLQRINQIPLKLWMGDCIYGVFPNTYQENSKGFMVITDKNIYFVPDDVAISGAAWFVRSYHLLSKVTIQDQCLYFTYKDVKVASIIFADKKKIFDAYQCIHDIIQAPK